jgi:hypothetical protein
MTPLTLTLRCHGAQHAGGNMIPHICWLSIAPLGIVPLTTQPALDASFDVHGIKVPRNSEEHDWLNVDSGSRPTSSDRHDTAPPDVSTKQSCRLGRTHMGCNVRMPIFTAADWKNSSALHIWAVGPNVVWHNAFIPTVPCEFPSVVAFEGPTKCAAATAPVLQVGSAASALIPQ